MQPVQVSEQEQVPEPHWVQQQHPIPMPPPADHHRHHHSPPAPPQKTQEEKRA
jgi:hypothetical protein